MFKVVLDWFKNKESKERIREKIEYLEYCHSNIQKLKSSIYQRASILVAAIAFMFTGFSFFILEVFKYKVYCIEHKVAVGIILILSIIFLILFLWTVCLAIKCLFPFDYSKGRTKNNGIKYEELADMNQELHIKDLLNEKMMFPTFDSVCNLGESNFRKMAKELNNEKILEQLINSTYYAADITKSRYDILQKAYIKLRCSMFVFAFMILICIIIKFASL